MLKGFALHFLKSRLKSGQPTDAAFARQVHLIAFVAGAFVRPQHVLTHAVLADVGVESALVDICEVQEEPAKHHARREGSQIETLFHLDDIVWSLLRFVFRSNGTQTRFVTSPVTGRADAVGAESEELSCRKTQRRNNSVHQTLTYQS